MNKFLKENKVFLAIIVGALIVGAALYFGLNKDEGGKESSSSQVECSAPSKVIVTKVIDGDTVVVEGGYHIRLLGIDADESSYPCYDVAKSRLEELILNKKVRLEKDVTDVDQYDRCLRYVFLDDQNIDLQLINEGLVIARFYPPDLKYQNEITEAEKTAIDGKVGCKWSGAAANSVNTENKIVFQWEKLTSELTSLNIIDACQAGNYYGKEMIIEGKVADTYHDSKSNTVFLNFEKAYPNHCFTSVIFSSDLYKFVQNPEDYYSGKTVRVKGQIKEYQGKPEIILEEPSQIEIGE